MTISISNNRTVDIDDIVPEKLVPANVFDEK